MNYCQGVAGTLGVGAGTGLGAAELPGERLRTDVESNIESEDRQRVEPIRVPQLALVMAHLEPDLRVDLAEEVDAGFSRSDDRRPLVGRRPPACDEPALLERPHQPGRVRRRDVQTLGEVAHLHAMIVGAVDLNERLMLERLESEPLRLLIDHAEDPSNDAARPCDRDEIRVEVSGR